MPDVTRLINSDEIQSVVRPAGPKQTKRPFTQRKNPLRNRGVLFRLNPYAQSSIRREIREQAQRRAGKLKKNTKTPRIPTSEAFFEQLFAP